MSRQFEARGKQYEILAAQAKVEGRPVSPLKDIPHSNRLKAQIKVVAKLHTKVDSIRDYHHKKNASLVASRYRKSAVEEHGVQFMIHNRKLANVAKDPGHPQTKAFCSRASWGSGTFQSLTKQRMVATPRPAPVVLLSRRNSKTGYTTVRYAVLLPGVIM